MGQVIDGVVELIDSYLYLLSQLRANVGRLIQNRRNRRNRNTGALRNIINRSHELGRLRIPSAYNRITRKSREPQRVKLFGEAGSIPHRPAIDGAVAWLVVVLTRAFIDRK